MHLKLNQNVTFQDCNSKTAKDNSGFQFKSRNFSNFCYSYWRRGFCSTVTICNVAHWSECGNIVALSIIKVDQPCPKQRSQVICSTFHVFIWSGQIGCIYLICNYSVLSKYYYYYYNLLKITTMGGQAVRDEERNRII